MTRVTLALCFLVGCHKSHPTRIFQLHPIGREAAIAIWGEEGGTNLHLGEVAPHGDRIWSVSLDATVDSAHAPFAVDNARIYLAHRDQDLWRLDARDVTSGHTFWSAQLSLAKQETNPKVCLADGSLVIWNEHSLVVVARETGQVRASLEFKEYVTPPTVTGPYVVVELADEVVAVSVASGSTSRLKREVPGCADGNEYVECRDGKILVRELRDLAPVATLTTTNREMLISSCGHFEDKRVVTAAVADEHQVEGTAVFVVDAAGMIVHNFEFPGDHRGGVEEYRWHDRSDLNGQLTRFSPLSVRIPGSKQTEIVALDLTMMTSKLVATLVESDVALFPIGGDWLWEPTFGTAPTIGSLNGTTGEVASTQLVATKLPQVLPGDVAASTIWMFSDKWTTGRFEVSRLDAAMHPLK